MKLKYNFILWFLLSNVMTYNSFAQADSLLYEFNKTPKTEANILSLIDLTFNISDYNADSALCCAYTLQKLEIPANEFELQGKRFLMLGTITKLKGKYEEANSYLNQALEIAEKQHLVTLQIISLYQIGDLNRCIGLLDESLQMLYLSRNLAYQHHLNHQYPKIYDRLSATYFQLADHDFNRFANIEIPNQNDIGTGKKTPADYIGLCKIYADSATIYAKLNNDIQTHLSSLNLIGAYFRYKKQYNDAIDYFYKALDLSIKLGFKTNVPNYYANISKACFDQEKYDQAIETGLKGYAIADELGMESYKSILSHTLSISYEKLKDFENALAFHIIETETREYLYSQENWSQISELDKKYQSEKKQQEIEYQKELLKLKNTEVFRLNIIIIVMLAVLAVIITGVIYIQKQKKRIHVQAEEITKQYRRLEKLDQFKESLTHALIHDLKNPLSQVILNTRNQNVSNAARKMLLLISNMLDVEKYETTEFKLNKEQHSLREILEEVATGQEINLMEKNLELHFHFTNYEILADKEVMIRVFDNLLTNAIRYSPLNRSIDVFAEPSGDDTLQISISNYGEPIPEEALPYIFDKYRQFGNSDHSSYRTTGLGLTFCKMAIETHGGKISARNNPEEGCSFRFTIQHTSKIIDVEGNENNVMDFKSKLRLAGADYEVLHEVVIKLKDFKIYEISRFHEVLDPLKETSGSSVNEWISLLFCTIYVQNLDEYNRLINLAENEQA